MVDLYSISIYTIIYIIYTWNPLMTLVLIGKNIVWEGSTTKIEDKKVTGIFIVVVCPDHLSPPVSGVYIYIFP